MAGETPYLKIRQRHGSIEEYVTEVELVYDLFEKLEDDTSRHLAPAIGAVCETLRDKIDADTLHQLFKNGPEIAAFSMVYNLYKVFVAGYIAGTEGMEFFPCICDVSQEQKDEYARRRREM